MSLTSPPSEAFGIRRHLLVPFLMATLPWVGQCKCAPESAWKPPGTVTVVKGKVALKKAAGLVQKKVGRETRLAVLDFTDASGQRTPFGVLVGDLVLEQLRDQQGLRLIERSRLRELLKEHASEYTGLLRAEAIRRLGKLLPVDVLVLGSYGPAATPGLIQVRGRFVLLSSGEILSSFTFFLRESQPSSKGASVEDPAAHCRQAEEPVTEALADLRGQERVDRLINRAVLVPFDLPCGRVHLRVMGVLETHRLFPERYAAFLSATLASIRQPSSDNRIDPILRHFASDGRLTRTEWEGVLSIVRRAQRAWSIRSFLRPLRRTPLLEEGRPDEIMKLATAGEIGRPRTLEPGKVVLALLRLLQDTGAGTPELRLEFYDRHHQHISAPLDPKERKRVASFLRGNYRDSGQGAAQKKSLVHLSTLYSTRMPEGEAVDNLWDFLRDLRNDLERARSEGDRKVGEKRSHDLVNAATALKTLVCAGIDDPRSGVREARRELVLAGGLRCAGFPDVARIISDLGSRNEQVQLRAAHFLELMGPQARPAHDAARLYLGIRGSSHRQRMLRRHSARILGNLRTREPRAIALLIETLTDYEGAHKDAEEALVRIGAPAVPALLRALHSSTRSSLPFRVVVVLGELGAEARTAVSALEGIVRRNPSAAIARQAQASLELIRTAK